MKLLLHSQQQQNLDQLNLKDRKAKKNQKSQKRNQRLSKNLARRGDLERSLSTIYSSKTIKA
jgi:hypothetical protein